MQIVQSTSAPVAPAGGGVNRDIIVCWSIASCRPKLLCRRLELAIAGRLPITAVLLSAVTKLRWELLAPGCESCQDGADVDGVARPSPAHPESASSCRLAELLERDPSPPLFRPCSRTLLNKLRNADATVDMLLDRRPSVDPPPQPIDTLGTSGASGRSSTLRTCGVNDDALVDDDAAGSCRGVVCVCAFDAKVAF